MVNLRNVTEHPLSKGIKVPLTIRSKIGLSRGIRALLTIKSRTGFSGDIA